MKCCIPSFGFTMLHLKGVTSCKYSKTRILRIFRKDQIFGCPQPRQAHADAGTSEEGVGSVVCYIECVLSGRTASHSSSLAVLIEPSPVRTMLPEKRCCLGIPTPVVVRAWQLMCQRRRKLRLFYATLVRRVRSVNKKACRV